MKDPVQFLIDAYVNWILDPSSRPENLVFVMIYVILFATLAAVIDAIWF